MRLDQHLDPELVLTGVDAADATAAIRIFARHLAEKRKTLDPGVVEQELLERERSHSTSMGQGIAIPHATVDGPEAPVLMIARAGRPVPFGPPEDEPAWFFFVLLSPPGLEREHIRILARICRLIRDPALLKALRDAEEAQILSTIGRADRARG